MTKCGEPQVSLTFDEAMRAIDQTGPDFEWVTRIVQRQPTKTSGQEGFGSRDALNMIESLQTTEMKKGTDTEDILSGIRSVPAAGSDWYIGMGVHDSHRYQQKSPALALSPKSSRALGTRHFQISAMELWYLLRLVHDHTRCHGYLRCEPESNDSSER
jgi:hypothetical protein